MLQVDPANTPVFCVTRPVFFPPGGLNTARCRARHPRLLMVPWQVGAREEAQPDKVVSLDEPGDPVQLAPQTFNAAGIGLEDEEVWSASFCRHLLQPERETLVKREYPMSIAQRIMQIVPRM